MRMHGNIYELPNGWFVGDIYNILNFYAEGLDGHYKILFRLDGTFKVFKQADYATSNPLANYQPKSFNGFENLTNHATKFIKNVVSNTLMSMQFYNKGGRKKMGTLWVFDYTGEEPDYMKYLK